MLAAGLALFWATREPLCQGKPVRIWVEVIGQGQYGPQQLAEEQLETVAPLAVSALLEALRTDRKPLRDQINDWWLKLWSKLPPGVQKLTPQPRFYFKPDRRMWIQALGRFGPHDKRAPPALIRELGNKDSEVRFFATSTLGDIATNWADEPAMEREIIQSLERMLKDTAFNVRGSAAYSLARCGPAAGGSVPALIALLNDPEEHSRSAAVRAISYIGGDSNLIVPAIAPLLQSTQLITRAFAAYAICQATGDTETGLPVLVGLLSAEEHEWEDSPRSIAAGLIGRLGTRAESALPDLQRAMESSETGTRIEAARAIWRISGNPSNAIPVLRSALAKGNRGERIWITEKLAEFGPEAADALPELMVALQDQDFLIRGNAVRAIGNIGPAAAIALPNLKLLLTDPFPSIRRNVAKAITKISAN